MLMTLEGWIAQGVLRGAQKAEAKAPASRKRQAQMFTAAAAAVAAEYVAEAKKRKVGPMKVDLFNKSGTQRIITVEVPTMHEECDVIMWGDRTFVLDDRTERFVERDLYVHTNVQRGPVK